MGYPGATRPVTFAPTMPVSCSTLDYAATGAFSPLVLDYLAGAPHLTPFYHRPPTLAALGEQLTEKAASYSAAQRATLATEVRRQYLDRLATPVHPAVVRNLDALAASDTFTVTTGHQLSLLTGPLYFIYKIVSTIKLAQQLQAAYPAHRFVPVFWMATEDHDLAEIDHFTAFGQTFRWQTPQTGATGRMHPDPALRQVLAALPQRFPELEAAYDAPTLADATRRLVHTLFGEYGLVALDADSPALKAVLRPVVESEISGPTIQQAVHRADEELAAWYKPQVYARPLNFFYLDGTTRERLERRADGSFAVLNTPLTFSESELREMAALQPERFSPNAVLRPLYQELLLPNLAYIGGGAEVAYWLQLKGMFAQFNVPFPVVLLRNSALYLPATQAKRARQLELAPADLFQDLATMRRQLATRRGDAPLTLADEQARVAAVFEELRSLAVSLDTTLDRAVRAEAHRAADRLDHLRRRLQRARDGRHATDFARLTVLKEALFPGGALQERVENVLSLLAGTPRLIADLVACFDPLAGRFTVLLEE